MTNDIITSAYLRKNGGFDPSPITGVRLTHVPTRLAVSCHKFRSQHKNHACCVQAMKAAIRENK